VTGIRKLNLTKQAQLSQTDRAVVRSTSLSLNNFATSLKVTQGHSK